MKKKSVLHVCLITLLFLLFTHQTALAHEHITIGDYELVIGWLEEPPIAGQKNAITITVLDQSNDEALPMEDVSALQVTVSYGGQNKALTLEPLGDDSPGEFLAPILPTVPGEYTVLLGGQIGETAVEAEVHVEEVQSADVLEFPILDSSLQRSSVGVGDWLTWFALLLGLAGVVLGITAHRKAG